MRISQSARNHLTGFDALEKDDYLHFVFYGSNGASLHAIA